MNKEVSRAWPLNLKPLFGLPFYENKKNNCQNPYKVLAGNKHIFKTHNPNPQRLFWLNTIHSSKTLKRFFYFLKGRWLRNPERLYRSLPNKSQLQAALFKDGLFLPIETQKLSAHNLQWYLLLMTKFHELGLLLLFLGAFVCFFTEEVLSHNRMVKWLWSRVTSACSSLKRGFGSLPEMEAVLSDNTLASQLCRK